MAVYLFNNEFNNCIKLSDQRFPICENQNVDCTTTKESIDLFRNNRLRFKALALEKKFTLKAAKREHNSKSNKPTSHLVCDAILAAKEATSIKTVDHGLALAKF